MIIYLHGYGSSGNGDTANELRRIYPNIVTPSYDPHNPCESLKSILRIVDSADDEEDVIIIASSLGGWYAEKIASVRNVDLVLYNPSTKPATSLKKYGVEEKVLDTYAILSSDEVRPGVRRYVIICEDDDVVNPHLAKEKYLHRGAIFYSSGGHRMTDANKAIIVSKVEYLLNSYN